MLNANYNEHNIGMFQIMKVLISWTICQIAIKGSC